jgi:4-diphosphocytidyl-2-C-methyl-D-erythritol kinase
VQTALSFITYPKVNVFLKIVGTRGHYHTLVSRFILVKDIYDTLTFLPSKIISNITIEGDFDCQLEDNTLYKAISLLQEEANSTQLDQFVTTHILHVEKRVPSFAGLGGGSSNAAGVLLFLNNYLKLGFSTNELIAMGVKIGADVPFFLSGLNSANVSGIGEIIEPFDEEELHVSIHTNSLRCATPDVYRHFRANFIDSIDTNFAQTLSQLTSNEILSTYEPLELNDLYRSADKLYPSLGQYAKKGYFFSGSGSAFFSLKGHHG